MFIESYSIKTVSLIGAGIVAIVGAVPVMAPEQETTINFIERTGAFGLVVAFFIFVLYAVYLCIPRIFAYVDSSRKDFLAEIAAERIARDKSVADHREMLQAHKHDLIATMNQQTAVIQEQNHELDRIATLIEHKPCILKRTPQGDYIAP